MRIHDAATDDEGFGLVEIVVSMLILGLLAISFLPLLIQGMKVTVQNRVLATATQIVNDELEQARSLGTCDGLVAFGANTAQPNPDYDVARVVEHPDDPLADACTIDYPGVLRLTIRLEDASDDTLLVEATTLVLVRTEN
ncbi:MAG TPA: type II secretion system protein [Terrimesophilobacter sp.]|nr:type II secretion system protein [Terrimesophilobacter sp.]HRP99220.1 type II secretion system protein [Terrimesophilobacter sp.]